MATTCKCILELPSFQPNGAILSFTPAKGAGTVEIDGAQVPEGVTAHFQRINHNWKLIEFSDDCLDCRQSEAQS